MIIYPYEKIADVPTGLGGNAEITASSDLIEVMDRFRFQTLRATNKSYFRGVSGYMFEAQVRVGFGKDYKVLDVEIRRPFGYLDGKGAIWGDLNLLRATLAGAQVALHKEGVATTSSDVGFDALDLGLSFFSNDYEDNLDVSLDAITIHLNR